MTAKNTETKTSTKAEDTKPEPNVKVRFTADSWRRKRGDVKEVPAKVAEKLISNGHAEPVK